MNILRPRQMITPNWHGRGNLPMASVLGECRVPKTPE